jgi:hypothetical protein
MELHLTAMGEEVRLLMDLLDGTIPILSVDHLQAYFLAGAEMSNQVERLAKRARNISWEACLRATMRLRRIRASVFIESSIAFIL